MIQRRVEFSKIDVQSVKAIERLIQSEEYGVDNPVVDIEKIAKNVFCIECRNCDVLQNMRVQSVSVKPKKLILLSPLLNKQERKIEIARQLVQIFYAGKNSNIDFIAGSFFVPRFLYKALAKNSLSPQQVLSRLGFDYSSFWWQTIDYLSEPHSLLEKLKYKLGISISATIKDINLRSNLR